MITLASIISVIVTYTVIEIVSKNSNKKATADAVIFVNNIAKEI